MPSRDTSRKRESILDAALQAFQNEGYYNTSMDRIAELAGASKRTVYNHFTSKDALFKAVVNRFMGEISALKQIPYDAERSLEEQLAQFADTKLRILDNPALAGAYATETTEILRELVHSLTLPNDPVTRFKGRLGVRKRVAWTDPIPLDEVIDASYAVGRQLPPELRCTALGGVAITPAAQALVAKAESGGLDA